MRKETRNVCKNGSAALHRPWHGHRKPTVARERRIKQDASRFIVDALFTTITNANFDNDMLDGYITKALDLKNELEGESKSAAWSLLSCLRCRIISQRRNMAYMR